VSWATRVARLRPERRAFQSDLAENVREVAGDQFLPTEGTFLEDVCGWLRSSVTRVAWMVKGSGGGWGRVLEELGDDATARLRFRSYRILDRFRMWPADMRVVWSAAWCVWSDAERAAVDRWVSHLYSVTRDDVQRQLKALSDLVVKYGARFGQHWRIIAYLHLLRDYQPAAEIDDFRTEVGDWVSGPEPMHASGGDHIEQVLALGFSRWKVAARTEREYVPLDDWLADPMYWARSGSSDGRRLHVWNGKKMKKAPKSKWATAAASDLAYLRGLYFSPAKQSGSALQKRELGKVRAVMTGDLGNYLRMSRVSYWLEHLLAGDRCSTLFMNSAQQMGMWEHCMRELEWRWLIPLDESRYDHQITWGMLDAADAWLAQVIREHASEQWRDELLGTLALIHDSLRGGIVRVGQHSVAITKGVLSGWRWTALYDTLLNVAKVRGFTALLARYAGYSPPTFAVSQGDDVLFSATGARDAAALWSLYDSFGFIVNPSKFFVEAGRGEYLRQIITVDSIRGYPGRAIGSLVFANPVVEATRGPDKLRSTLNQWLQLFLRLGRRPMWRLIVTDLAKATGVCEQDVCDWLRTPAHAGGAGVWCDRHCRIDLVVEEQPVAVAQRCPLAARFEDGAVQLWLKTLATRSVNFRVRRSSTAYSPRPGHRPIPAAHPKRLSPTSAALLEQRIQRARACEIGACAIAYLDVSSWAAWDWMSRHASLGAQRAWLLGKTDPPTPALEGWSQFQTSVAMQQAWRRVGGWRDGARPTITTLRACWQQCEAAAVASLARAPVIYA